MLTNHQWWFFGIHRKEISQAMLKIAILDMSFKITHLRLQLILPGSNELTQVAHLKVSSIH